MKTVLLSILFLFVSFTINAKEYPGYYITNNSDTIQCTIKRMENTIFGNYVFLGVSRRVLLVDHEGKKTFYPQEIKCFVVMTPDGGSHKFVSLKEDNSYFFNEIIEGKISLYKAYFPHGYDRSQQRHVYIYKDDTLVNLSLIGNRKNRVTPFFQDNPAIAAKWETVKFDFDILEELINEYNLSYTNLSTRYIKE